MSELTLKKKYGLFTAIAMVVGVVIGSGVFFKADDVLNMTGGNLIISLIAWGLGAFSMIFGSLVFAEFAQRIEKSNGIVDYSEAAYGLRFGYLVGWFKGFLYYTPLSAILAWVSALYTSVLLGSSNPENGKMTWVLAIGYMTLFYLLNFLSPILSGKFQVSAMIIKLIPLTLIASVGTISGLLRGVTFQNFSNAITSFTSTGGTLATAVVATAFAYEGWITAITINSEIKNSKKNLPKALIFGSIIVFLVYIFYFLGIASILPTEMIMKEGNNAVGIAASTIFGSTAATLLTAFVVISCLGTLNGLILSTSRIPYSLALRNQGPFPKWMSKRNERFDVPQNSMLTSAALSFGYLGIWYCSLNNIFGKYIAIDEIPIVMIYGIYVFLYIWYIRKFTDLGFVKRFVVPICATLGAAIILYGGITNPSIGMYLGISISVMLLGLLFYRKEK